MRHLCQLRASACVLRPRRQLHLLTRASPRRQLHLEHAEGVQRPVADLSSMLPREGHEDFVRRLTRCSIPTAHLPRSSSRGPMMPCLSWRKSCSSLGGRMRRSRWTPSERPASRSLPKRSPNGRTPWACASACTSVRTSPKVNTPRWRSSRSVKECGCAQTGSN